MGDRKRDAYRAALRSLEACADQTDQQTRRSLARAARRYIMRAKGLDGPGSR